MDLQSRFGSSGRTNAVGVKGRGEDVGAVVPYWDRQWCGWQDNVEDPTEFLGDGFRCQITQAVGERRLGGWMECRGRRRYSWPPFEMVVSR